MRTLVALLCVALPKLLAGGGQFILNLLLIRHFSPISFGVLSVCLTALLLLDSFLGSATDMAVLRLAPLAASQGDMEESYRIQKAGLFLKPLAIAAIGLPLIFFREDLSQVLFQRREFSTELTLTVVALGTILFLRSIQTFFQVKHSFKWYGGADLAHNTLRYGFVAYAVHAGFATPRLVLTSYAVAPLIIAATLLCGPARALFNVAPTWASSLKLASTLAWFVPAAAVGGVTSRMDVFFLSHLAGVKEAGIFSAAQAIALPVLLLGTYLSVVFGPRIMPALQAGSFVPFYKRFQIFVLAMSALTYGILLSIQPWLSGAFFPPRFQQSWHILIVLFPSVLAGLASFPLTISLLLFLKPRFLFFVDACAIPFLCAAYYLLGRKYGAIGAAVVTTAYSLVKLAVLQFAAWRFLKRKDQSLDPGCCKEVEFSRA